MKRVRIASNDIYSSDSDAAALRQTHDCIMTMHKSVINSETVPSFKAGGRYGRPYEIAYRRWRAAKKQ